MEKGQEEDICMINNLPDEIISMILINNECRDILHFSATCKRFNDLVNSDQTLWKNRFKDVVSDDMADIIEKEPDVDWLSEVKRYIVLQKKLYSELLNMSPQFYWRTSDVSLEDMKNVYAIALSHNLSYYYTVITLQDTIKRGRNTVDNWACNKPLTLTEMHYARVALRHLIHSFLCVKWVKQHIKNELSPENVVNFFVQWADTDNLYPDEQVADAIQELTKKVEDILNQKKPSKNESVQARCAKGTIKHREILEAISQLIYHQLRMVVTPTANVDNLYIVKVIESKCGNPISIGAIYNAIAKKFGVDCDLVSFPNHLYLEWREHDDGATKLYTVDLKTGAINPKRRCPFSQAGAQVYKYYPDSLLQYIYSMFHMTMGAIKNWHTQNALHLLDFLGTDDNAYNPYRNFLPFLLDITHLPAMNIDLNLKYLTQPHMQIIKSLSKLNTPFNTVCRSMIVRPHCSNVRYAVGMICYHKKYDYVCIVRGWDFTCAVEWQRRMETDTLEFGSEQPFYHVIAADQSERYVAQENLVEVQKPSRLYHLEDFIAREFTHFDGFAYAPNNEKKTEYPEEGPIVERYRLMCEMRENRKKRESAADASNSSSVEASHAAGN
ncbi:hemimethylated DNA-binding protein yccV like domain-containing protein [Phthorimaea operculella]|nr:hemimethylated DNA-binding protein yccV like domain-containing protein [Phthorimaea operculella]